MEEIAYPLVAISNVNCELSRKSSSWWRLYIKKNKQLSFKGCYDFNVMSIVDIKHRAIRSGGWDLFFIPPPPINFKMITLWTCWVWRWTSIWLQLPPPPHPQYKIGYKIPSDSTATSCLAKALYHFVSMGRQILGLSGSSKTNLNSSTCMPLMQGTSEHEILYAKPL